MHRHIRRRIQPRRPHWVPACAGTTTLNRVAPSQRHRGTTAGTRKTTTEAPPARHSGAGRKREAACVAAPTAALGTGLRRYDDSEPGCAFCSDVAAPRPGAEQPQPKPHQPVIPAQAGIQKPRVLPHHAPHWVPAFAGTTKLNRVAPFPVTSQHHGQAPNKRRRSPTRSSFRRRPESRKHVYCCTMRRSGTGLRRYDDTEPRYAS